MSGHLARLLYPPLSLYKHVELLGPLSPWHRFFLFIPQWMQTSTTVPSLSVHTCTFYATLPALLLSHMYTYQPPEIPVGWPQPDVRGLVLIKGPDSLLEPVLMERGEAGLHTQVQMLHLPSAVMSWLGPHPQCLPYLQYTIFQNNIIIGSWKEKGGRLSNNYGAKMKSMKAFYNNKFKSLPNVSDFTT